MSAISRCQQARDVVRRRLADDVDAGLACRLRRLRPDGHCRDICAETAERTRRRRRGEDDEVACGSDVGCQLRVR